MPTHRRKEESAHGLAWADMDARPRHAASALTRAAISSSPGVYALYRDGERLYIGKATSLRSRVGRQHLSKGASMTNSALRRNICEHLGLARAADIKARRYRTTAGDALRVTQWLASCDFAWVECATAEIALEIEAALRREFKPPLNRI